MRNKQHAVFQPDALLTLVRPARTEGEKLRQFIEAQWTPLELRVLAGDHLTAVYDTLEIDSWPVPKTSMLEDLQTLARRLAPSVTPGCAGRAQG